ncbi:putative sulfatase family protein [Teratosphaeria destructans]|uniref:Arylsulfatase n=1 Tax=Teratosphaeria destructans TaxID=418781 RepID=A0A9W7VZN1_9PEZI|nr:putative sulfatase family protein [Teratosphaeria destructans]
MDSLSYMPHLKTHLTDRGTTFQRHYCTNALCCPSRVNLWTGKAPHNTNVTDVNPPYGGYPKFISQGFNDAYLPVWLQEAGYDTYYVGKLFNAQTVDNYASPHAAGWTGSEFLLDPYTYEYLNATFQRNHDMPRSYEGQYSTDVLNAKALDFLDDAARAKKPFFLTIAPTAPHSNVHINEYIDGNFSERSVVQAPPIPAERHQHLFEDVVVPRTPHFNPDNPHGVSWISRLPKQNSTNVDFNDHFYRSRLRALQAVDELFAKVDAKLAAHDLLDNTYFFYSTDNGYHIGQHRLQPGKQCAFEEDINIPLIVRGPGVPAGEVSNIVTSHTDLAPTFLHLAGMKPRDDFDGVAIPLTSTQLAEAADTRHEHVNVEMWGIIMSEGKYGSVLYPNHTYKALRVIGDDYNLLYTVWCSGEHELYDLAHDPYQTTNLLASDSSRLLHLSPVASPPIIFRVPHTSHDPPPASITSITSRLDTLLQVLRTCTGRSCTHPWEVLHPSGDVHTLRDALAPRFDDFYERRQERVRFEKCEKGYILESEGPVGVKRFATVDEIGARGGARWADLV